MPGDGWTTIEWTFRGTHRGDLPGLPARGEDVCLEGVSVCRMEGDLIREERVYWDAATLLAGAGVLGRDSVHRNWGLCRRPPVPIPRPSPLT